MDAVWGRNGERKGVLPYVPRNLKPRAIYSKTRKILQRIFFETFIVLIAFGAFLSILSNKLTRYRCLAIIISNLIKLHINFSLLEKQFLLYFI